MIPPVPLLVLVPALPVGGAERQLAALARGLDTRRFRPLVACQHALGPVADEIAGAGVPVHLLSGGGRVDPGFLPRTARLLRREGVRLVLTHGFSTGVVGRLAAVAAGVPVRVLAEHSTGERDMSPGRHRLNRLLNPWTSAWIAVAHGQRDYLLGTKGIPARRLHVIHNGIDPATAAPADARSRLRASLGLATDAPVATIVAVLRPEKDHRTFLMAARLVADELPAARFLVVGDGPLAPGLAREIAALGLEEQALLLGLRGDVPEILAASDVAVLSSTDVETLPLAFLEAMVAGLPLVATRVGGLPELVAPEENGLLVRPRDAEGLAAALLRVLREPELARAWGRASRTRVEREFSAAGMVRAYEALFTRLLSAAGVPLPPPDDASASAGA